MAALKYINRGELINLFIAKKAKSISVILIIS